MTSKTIVVIGATGTQGGSVVRTYLNEPGWKIRGLTRNNESKASQALRRQGVEMINANLDDPASLDEAFKGAHSIFAMVDFWTAFLEPASQAKVAPGQTLLEYTHDYELQQGKNIFDAAARASHLERLVFSGLSYATKWSGGKYRNIYHFDAEGRAVEYAHETYPDLMRRTSVVQIGMYLTNTLRMPHYQPKKNKDGVYVFSTNIPANCVIPMISTEEDTGPLVKALFENEPGKNLVACRDRLTLAEYTSTWGKVMKVPTRYVELEEWDDLPDNIKIDISEASKYFAEFGFAGGDPTAIYPQDLAKPPELGTVAEWISSQDWNLVL